MGYIGLIPAVTFRSVDVSTGDSDESCCGGCVGTKSSEVVKSVSWLFCVWVQVFIGLHANELLL